MSLRVQYIKIEPHTCTCLYTHMYIHIHVKHLYISMILLLKYLEDGAQQKKQHNPITSTYIILKRS